MDQLSVCTLLTLVSALFLTFSSLCLGQKDIEQVLELVKSVSDPESGCSDDKVRLIKIWWDETYNLLNHALTALIDMSDPDRVTDKELVRYLAAYYAIDFTSDGEPIGSAHLTLIDRLQGVADFMNGVGVGGPTQIPLMFCDSLWLQETEDAYFTNGRRHTDNGRQLSIRESNVIHRAFPNIRNQINGDWELYLYWAPRFHQYLKASLNKRYNEDASHRRHACVPSPGQMRARAAAVLNPFARKTITLCPTTFDSRIFSLNTVSEALASSHVNREGRMLQVVEPRTTVLMHELFHLALGKALTPDNGYGWLSVVVNRNLEPWSRPETNTYFMYAFYLSKKGQPSMDWSTGYATHWS